MIGAFRGPASSAPGGLRADCKDQLAREDGPLGRAPGCSPGAFRACRSSRRPTASSTTATGAEIISLASDAALGRPDDVGHGRDGADDRHPARNRSPAMATEGLPVLSETRF